MCMLCVIPPDTIPTREKLENSALNNPHGFGFAIVVPEENRIICERTMSADESINRFLELRQKHMTGFALWHARIATSGTVTIDNCHPFVMPDNDYPNTTYVGHNGMLDVYEAKEETRSDTRIFVEDLLPAMGGVTALDNIQIFNMLDDFTNGSKVCVLTVHPLAQYQMYLFHEQSGKYDDDGVWWSNNSCELSVYKSYANGYYRYDDNYAAEYAKWIKETGDSASYNTIDCQACGTSFDWDLSQDDKCIVCHSCLMCDLVEGSCLCYRPKRWEETPTPEGGWLLS